MPTGPGSTTDGIYSYGEADATGPLFSDFLNLLANSVRSRINAVVSAGKIVDSGWINLPLVNSWAAAGGETPQYRKLNGVVYLTGIASGGTGVAATLPAGYRPGTPERGVFRHLTTGSSTVGYYSIDTAGAISVTASTQPNLGGFAPYIAS